MNDQNMPKADFITSIILLAFSLLIIILSLKMPRMEEVGADPYSAPGVVPGLIGGILLCLSLIMLTRSARQRGYQLHLSRQGIAEFFFAPSTRRVLLTIFISALYGIGLLGRVPYVIATLLYVLAFVLLFEYQRSQSFQRQRKTVIFACVLAVLTTASVAAVFRYLFLVNLP